MSSENEEYFAQMKLMMQTPGWQLLLEDLRNNGNAINDVQATKDGDDLYYRKGQLSIIGFILNLEETIRRAEAEQAAESELTSEL